MLKFSEKQNSILYQSVSNILPNCCQTSRTFATQLREQSGTSFLVLVSEIVSGTARHWLDHDSGMESVPKLVVPIVDSLGLGASYSLPKFPYEVAPLMVK